MQLEILYKELPENVCLVYTTICNKKYGIINNAIDDREKQLLEQACYYKYENNLENTIVCTDSKYPGEKVDAFFEHLNQTKKLKKEFFFLDQAKLQAIRDDKLA